MSAFLYGEYCSDCLFDSQVVNKIKILLFPKYQWKIHFYALHFALHSFMSSTISSAYSLIVSASSSETAIESSSKLTVILASITESDLRLTVSEKRTALKTFLQALFSSSLFARFIRLSISAVTDLINCVFDFILLSISLTISVAAVPFITANMVKPSGNIKRIKKRKRKRKNAKLFS